MNSNLQFEFLVDRGNKTLTIVREFAAKRQLVWAAHTDSKLLEQWFAPKPWKAKSKKMDFREGGYWLYAMCGPDGEEHWARTDYVKINPISEYVVLDGFCDAEGVLNPDLPRAHWHASFKELGDHTLVETVITYHSLEDLETILQMGMKEGLSIAMEGLDELLLTLTS